MNPYGTAAPQPAGAEDPAGAGPASGAEAESTEGARGAAPETAEYEGPDYAAGLAQQTPYETAAQGNGQEPSGQDYSQGYGQGYGEAPAAPAYGQASADQSYGQAPAPGYGQAPADQGYGQGTPAPGYGQGSPAPGYGQGSASDYPAPGYGQGSPAPGDPGAAWTASTGAGEPPKKGVIQRFWWVGCLLLLLLALILIAAGGIWLFTRSGDEQAGGDETTSAEQTTEGEATDDATATEEEPLEEEPTDADSTDEVPMPTDLATIDPEAEKDAIDIVGTDGTGTIAVQMEYAPASDLESSWGGTVQEPENGDEYLVVTAKMTVAEGEQYFSPGTFSVITPYGGEVGASSETYGLKGSGTDGPSDFSEGDEYTLKMLFDVRRAEDLTLNFTTFSDDYSWDVPA